MSEIDTNKIDLNKPAFGEGAQKLEELIADASRSSGESTEEIKKEEKPEDTLGEGQMVKYSRFKKFHDQAEQYKQEAEMWRQKAEAIRPERVERDEVQLPNHWVKLYGDSDASKEAWQIQSEQNETLKAEARAEALDAVRNERYVEAQAVEENIGAIDESIDLLKDFVGRDLTEKEEEGVLDIVDQYSPVGNDGKYIEGAMMPFEKAWEIYELKQGSSNAPKRSSRDAVASLSGSPSQGDADIQAEKDKNFNPLDWNSYKKFL